MMQSFRVSLCVVPLFALAAHAGCSSSDSDGNPESPGQDAGSEASIEAGPEASGDTAAPDDVAIDSVDEAVDDASEDTTADTAQDTAPDAVLPTTQEQEPNNGATTDEYNDLELKTVVSGAIGTVGDGDIFRVPTLPGKVYTATLVAAQSELQGNVTVLDTGRGGNPAGDDYVKLANAVGDSGSLAWLAMGDGGHFVVVRDQRNLSDATVGGAGFTYELVVQERAATDFEGAPLDFTLPMSDALLNGGDLKLYPFDGVEGTDVLIEFEALGDMDGRLMVFNENIGSWILRNDDQSVGNSDPKIDGWLTESGSMWLVVENVDQEATQFGYAITASLP